MTEKGTVLDEKYEILKEIGRGGMSIVYVAMDLRLNKQWAIKEIKDDGSQDTQTLLKGLEREANILKKVDHPVLPRIVDIIQKENKVYVVMDYVEGRPLSKILEEQGAQPQDQVIQWAKDLASALDYLHSMDPPIIYRDMKPSNIMLRPDGKVKLIDFGTAKEYKIENNADTTALGTRGYAAPEQFGDEQGRGIYNTDARTDIYCLGATLYHIVTGMNPCEPPYKIEPIRKWNPALSSGLEKILLKCTQPNPSERYQSCSELLYALEHYDQLDDEHRKQNSTKLALFAIAAVSTLIFAGISLMGFSAQSNLNDQNYYNIISEGDNYKFRGEYDQAILEYQNAISANAKNEEAYIKILNLYVNNLNEPERGLDTIASYVNGNKSLSKNDHLLYQLGITYFNQGNYEAALRYFRMVNEKSEEYGPISKHYIAIAMGLSSLNIDYSELEENLREFESDNASLSFSDAKLMNYQNLGMIYSIYMNSVNGADEAIKRVLEPALQELAQSGSTIDNSSGYYYHYNLYLAYAYQSLARKSEDEVMAREYYYRALECCENVVSQISPDEDLAVYENMYVTEAEVYTALGMEKETIATYEEAENILGTSSASIYVNHLRFLYNKYKAVEPDVSAWNAPDIIKVYEAGSSVPGITENFEWKPLVANLQPLFDKVSGRLPESDTTEETQDASRAGEGETVIDPSGTEQTSEESNTVDNTEDDESSSESR
ncbi:MAG: protein kinase [Lachnospiraceae bacterium]|nr:protein kinase [Lachnospiraceae bacterium]